MAICDISGNADMYGLGIRLGYYLQWYGAMLASLLAQNEVEGARLSLALFISATFLALLIQTVRHNLYIVEIYVILLLTFGSYISMILLLLWRLITCCDPLVDPSRFPLVDAGATHSDLHKLLLLAVTGFQLWFWIAKVPELDNLDCPRYGLIFARVRSNDPAFQVTNIILYFAIGISVLVMCALRIGSVFSDPDGSRRDDEWERRKTIYRRKYGRKRLHQHIRRLQVLDLVNRLVTASIIVLATELTVQWNHIGDINEIASAGQLIPFVIGLGVVVRVLYVWWKQGFSLSPIKKPPRRGSDNVLHPTPPYQLPGPPLSPLPIPSHDMPTPAAMPIPGHQFPMAQGIR